MKFGVLVFPGSNCDHDTYNVIDALAKQHVPIEADRDASQPSGRATPSECP